MGKSFVLALLTAAGVLSAISFAIESAQAQDYYHRDSRERRRGDYRRGVGDGRDCNQMAHEALEILCAERWGQVATDCWNGRNQFRGHQETFLEIAAGVRFPPYYEARTPDETNRLRQKAREALSCQGDREESFDRDTQRESDEWHERQEREQGERPRN